MAPVTIEHITITTGATRMSSRSEVDDAVVRRVVDAIGADGMLWGGWTYEAEAHHPAGAWRFVLRHEATPIVRCWLSVSAEVPDEIWSEAADQALDERVVLRRPRGVPCLASTLLPDALIAPREAVVQAGDAERCVAWALIESRAA